MLREAVLPGCEWPGRLNPSPIPLHLSQSASPTPYTTHPTTPQIRMPKGANFGVPNPNIPMEVDDMTPDFVAQLEFHYLQRLRSLRAVDEMLDAVGELLVGAAAGMERNPV